jgi:UDP-N-acetylglucosamine 3-dehydrogenase
MRVVVIGAGVMGSNHARTVASSRDVDLIAVADPDIERASTLASAHGARAAADISELAGEFDAVIVAAPTHLHRNIALPLLGAGKHVLVEKPIATDLASATELIEAAQTAAVTLMVGHIERFNPVVMTLPQFVEDPLHLEFFRMGPFTSRIPDSVVLDLMIHDIDIATSLAGSRVASVSTVSQSVRSASEDLVTALLSFENGVTASLTASRVGQQKIREIRVTQKESVITADLVRGHLEINRVAHTEYLSDAGRRYRQSGVVEIPFIENRGEPLVTQLAKFARHARAGCWTADAESAAYALEVAQEIIACCRANRETRPSDLPHDSSPPALANWSNR